MLDLVIKIGGSILTSAKDYIIAAERISNLIEESVRPFIIVSAARGVTDKLLKACHGDKVSLYEVKHVYQGIAGELNQQAIKILDDILDKLERTLSNLTSCTKRLEDYIASFGEIISKILMVYSLENLGVNVLPLNALDLVVADGVYGDSRIDYEITMLNLSKIVGYVSNVNAIPVMEGFIGRSWEGEVVTLGRGGSDYTAVTVATLLGIPEVHLLTDVPGIMSIDPTLSSKARIVKVLDYDEAIEASLYGVKRINPKTFEPITLGLGRPKVAIGTWDLKGTIIGDDVKGWRAVAKIVTLNPKDRSMVVVIGKGVSNKTFLLELLNLIGDDVILEIIASKSKPALVIKTYEGFSVKIAKLIHDELLVRGDG